MSTPTPDPRHAEIQELLGAYALDAVDPETAALVERHLDHCVRCSIEVAQHHEVAGLLANSGGTSPADLWDGIASRLDSSTPPAWEGLAGRLETGDHRADRVLGGLADSSLGEPSPVVSMSSRSPRRRWAVGAGAVVATAAAAVAIVLGVQVHHLNNQVSALQARSSLTAVEQAALEAPSTKRVLLSASAGSGGPAATGPVTVVLTSSGTGFVEAGRLSALPAHQTYQLWGVIGAREISLGLLGSKPGVVPFSVAGSGGVGAFAITAEHAGGVVHSANRPVVVGAVNA